MCDDNQTQVTEILLLGFQGSISFKIPLFTVFLLIYIVILSGNFLIICLVTTSEHLKTPMYYFLKHLGFADVFVTTSIVPMMLDIILHGKMTVSLVACIAQLYIFAVSGVVQCFLLAVMSYDRYLAICNPLHYISIMEPSVCLRLVIGSWLLVFIPAPTGITLMSQLHFCGLNYIDHFFCDFGPLVALSISDTSVLILQDFIFYVAMIFVPFAFIIISYVCIFITILRFPSSIGRKKFFSTCSAHLTVVCTYYGTLSIVYMGSYIEQSFNINKLLSLFYTVITPFLNPIIYSLRNKEIRGALEKYIKKRQMLGSPILLREVVAAINLLPAGSYMYFMVLPFLCLEDTLRPNFLDRASALTFSEPGRYDTKELKQDRNKAYLACREDNLLASKRY
ncbi:olfactory receptor 5P55-like [Rhinophrynus dorsalis]